MVKVDIKIKMRETFGHKGVDTFFVKKMQRWSGAPLLEKLQPMH
jgi:hypothetical protein